MVASHSDIICRPQLRPVLLGMREKIGNFRWGCRSFGVTRAKGGSGGCRKLLGVGDKMQLAFPMEDKVHLEGRERRAGNVQLSHQGDKEPLTRWGQTPS